MKIVDYTTNLLTVFESLLVPQTGLDDPDDAPSGSKPVVTRSN
jgi:hypothetical protein